MNNQNQVFERNYNIIISNVILSQEEVFTYSDIIRKIETIFENITNEIQSAVKQCLIRLRDDGFLNVLGSNYSVIELNI